MGKDLRICVKFFVSSFGRKITGDVPPQRDWFLNTANHYGEKVSWLGIHFNFVLLLFVPLYALFEHSM